MFVRVDSAAIVLHGVIGYAKVVPGRRIFLVCANGAQKHRVSKVDLPQLEPDDTHLVEKCADIAATLQRVAVIIESILGKAARAQDVTSHLKLGCGGCLWVGKMWLDQRPVRAVMQRRTF